MAHFGIVPEFLMVAMYILFQSCWVFMVQKLLFCSIFQRQPSIRITNDQHGDLPDEQQ